MHDWPLAHHTRAEAVWLVTWKKAVADRHVSHEAVLDALVDMTASDARQGIRTTSNG